MNETTSGFWNFFTEIRMAINRATFPDLVLSNTLKRNGYDGNPINFRKRMFEGTQHNMFDIFPQTRANIERLVYNPKAPVHKYISSQDLPAFIDIIHTNCYYPFIIGSTPTEATDYLRDAIITIRSRSLPRASTRDEDDFLPSLDGVLIKMRELKWLDVYDASDGSIVYLNRRVDPQVTLKRFI